MRSLHDTRSRLSRLRDHALPGLPGRFAEDRLSDLGAFGSNPGALRGRFYIPHTRRESTALVVVLHGCTQDAAGYDHGSGRSEEHTSELQSLMRISYAVFCLKKKI